MPTDIANVPTSVVPRIVGQGRTTLGSAAISTILSFTRQGPAQGSEVYLVAGAPNAGSPGKRLGWGASAPYATVGVNLFLEEDAGGAPALLLRGENAAGIGLSTDWKLLGYS